MSHLDHLHSIRAAELDVLLRLERARLADLDILEIGSGSGLQLQTLRRIARTAIGVDVPCSNYKPAASAGFVLYDGSNLPFADAAFDLIYSSNTMEHVRNEERLHAEMQRTLRPTGIAIHVVPSSSWRLWSMVTYYSEAAQAVRRRFRNSACAGQAQETAVQSGAGNLAMVVLDRLVAPRHGEHGNRFDEWLYFRRPAWRRRFEAHGWKVEKIVPVGLFYTGSALMGPRLSLSRRKSLSRWLGSSCLICFMRAARHSAVKQ
jgi:SAM-dependent methyltransferase